MKLLITGSSGFLGQYVVAEVLRRGHQVTAIVRRGLDENCFSWHDHSALNLVFLDLLDSKQELRLVEALKGIDRVIHLAAAKTGDFDTQYAGTVVTTKNLLNAMLKAQVRHIVAVSTFSVYDYLNMSPDEVLDEDSPIELNPSNRGAYAQTKLIQEEMIRDFGNKSGGQVVILRPSMIYGRNYLWNALLGSQLSEDRWLQIKTEATLPITYVENCAEAIVMAAECDKAFGQVLNVVDDDLPNQTMYINHFIKRLSPRPRIVSVHWEVINLLAHIIWTCNQWLLKGHAKLPGIFIPASLHARFKPFNYSNRKLKETLGWVPKYSLKDALDRSLSNTDLLSVPITEVR